MDAKTILKATIQTIKLFRGFAGVVQTQLPEVAAAVDEVTRPDPDDGTSVDASLAGLVRGVGEGVQKPG